VFKSFISHLSGILHECSIHGAPLMAIYTLSVPWCSSTGGNRCESRPSPVSLHGRQSVRITPVPSPVFLHGRQSERIKAFRFLHRGSYVAEVAKISMWWERLHRETGSYL